MNLNTMLRAGMLFATTAMAAFSVHADTFPSKPVKIIVPFSAGGTPDLSARLIAQKLSASWNSPVVVENRPGAGSTLGPEYVAKATPDGYTWLMTSASFSFSPGLYP